MTIKQVTVESELAAALEALLDWCAGGDIPDDLYEQGRAALTRVQA